MEYLSEFVGEISQVVIIAYDTADLKRGFLCLHLLLREFLWRIGFEGEDKWHNDIGYIAHKHRRYVSLRKFG